MTNRHLTRHFLTLAISLVGLLAMQASTAAPLPITYTPTDSDPGCIDAGPTCRRNITWTMPSLASDVATVVYGQAAPAWYAETAPGGVYVQALGAATDGTAWGTTGGGGLYKRNPTLDPVTWTAQNSGTSGYIMTVDVLDPTHAWLGAQSGYAARTNDGVNWQSMNLNVLTSGVVTRIRGISSSNVWALTASCSSGTCTSQLYHFNGAAWNLRGTINGTTPNSGCEDMATLNGDELWVACGDGRVAHITNALTAPTVNIWSSGNVNNYFNTVDTFDGVTVYAGGVTLSGPANLLYRSTNSGASFTSVVQNGSRFEKFRMSAPDKFWYVDAGLIASFDYAAAPASRVTFHTAAGGGWSRALRVRNDLIVAGSDSNSYTAYTMPSTSASWTVPGTTNTPLVQLANLEHGKRYYYAAQSQVGAERYGEFGAPFDTPAIDSIPPTISWTNPLSPGLYFKTCPLTLGGVAGDTAPGTVTGVTVTMDGTPLVVSGTTGWSVTIPCPIAAGSHTLVATATDGSNSTSATTTILYDSDLPTVTISAPATTTTIPITVTGSAADANSNVVKVEVSVNGGPRTNVPISAAPSIPLWTLTNVNLTPGPNTLIAYATDAAGNVSLGASTTVIYNVPSFDITADPPTSVTINAGQGTSFDIKLTALNGFDKVVNLTTSGAPSGMSMSPTPPNIDLNGKAFDYSTLVISTLPSTTTGTHTLTVTGTYNTIIKTVSVTVTINTAPDFTFTVNPVTNVPFVAGGNTTYTLSISGNSTYVLTPPTTISFSTSPLPAGVSPSFSALVGNPSNSGLGTATLTLTVTSVQTNLPIVLTATDGTISHTFTIYLTTTAPPDFSIDLQPATRSVTAGDTGPAGTNYYNATVTALAGFSGTVHLAAGTTPSDPNFTITFSANDFVPSSSGTLVTVNVTALSPVQCFPPGPCTYGFNVTGSAGAVVRTDTADLVVTPDLVPPIISNPAAAPDVNSVTVTWQTNELADSLVEIYTSSSMAPADWHSSKYLGDFCTNGCHNLTLPGLTESTDYWYSITSIDQAFPVGRPTTIKNHPVTGALLSFRTLAAPDSSPATLVITAPASGTTVVGGVNITATGQDDNVMQQVNLQISRPGDPSPTIDTALPCPPPASTTCNVSYLWNTMIGPVPNGSYIVSMVAVSSAGPPSAQVSITINVSNDTSAPLLQCLPGQIICEPEAIQTSLTCTGSPVRCSITIHWLTDDASTTEIEYGLAVDCSGSHTRPDGTVIPCNYTDFRSDAALTTNHSMTLTNLEPNKLYHYRITSCNVSNLCTN